MKPTLSVIVPTISRPTLRRALRSVLAAGAGPADELIVIGDGPNPDAAPLVHELHGKIQTYYGETPRLNVPGGPQRNQGMRVAFGSYLCFLDDDDVYRPGALEHVRAAIAEHPGKIFVFRMESKDPGKHPWAPYLWRDPVVRVGNVGTPMIVVPNVPGRLGRWGERAEGDFDFVESTVRLNGPGSVVWREEILAEIY